MSFSVKVLAGFVLWHIVVTVGGLIQGSLNYVEPTNDPDWVIEGVWRILWVVGSLIVSLIGVAVAYIFRALVVFARRK